MWNIGCGVTTQCNMKCEFCYSRNARNEYIEIDFNALADFIQLNNNEISAINYGTGENVLCSKWFEFVDYVRTNYPNIQQSLTTNGTVAKVLMKNPEYYEIFKNSIEEIDVSLDFYDIECHNKTRGVSTAYSGAIETIKMCKKMKKKVSIVCVAMDTSFNIDNLKGLSQLCAEYDIFLRINVLRTSDKNYKGLTKECLFRGLNYLFNNLDIVSVSDTLIAALYLNVKAVDNTGVQSIRILPDGWITPATYLITEKWKARNIVDKVKLKDLAELDAFSFFGKQQLPTECEGCTIANICSGGTYDRRLLVYENLDRKDPLCPMDNYQIIENNNLVFYNGDAPSIHNNYLPTIILKPRKSNAKKEI